MKLRKKPLSKKKLALLTSAAVVVLAGGAVGAAAYLKVGPFAQPKSSGSVNLDKPTKEQTDTGKTAKDNTVNDGTGGSDPSPAPIPDPSGGKSTVGMEITAANQNGALLQVRSFIQTVTSDGTCTLSMTGPGGKTYSQQAGVQAGPSTSTCKGFDVPVDQLAPGAWHITLSFENDSLKASTEKDVTVN